MQKREPVNRNIVMKAIENAKVGIWHHNLENNEILVNAAFAEMIGYSEEEINPISKIDWNKFMDPDEITNFSTKLDLCKSGKIDRLIHEFRMQHKNKTWINVQCNGSIVEFTPKGSPKTLSGIIIDITELIDSRQNLSYRYEIEKLVTGISLDFEGILQEDIDKVINRTLKKIGEFSNIDRSYVFMLRKNDEYLDNTHEWCSEGINPEINNLQNLPSSIFPWWMKKLKRLEHIFIQDTDNMLPEASSEQEILLSQNIISLLVVPIHYKKKLLGFMGFDSVWEEKFWQDADIHLLKAVGNIIANAVHAKQGQELLIKAKEEAEEGNRLKSAFLATMNHELRTPLHHILGFSDLLIHKSPNAEQTQNYASKIYKSGKKLLQIVEDILSLALADQSNIRIRNEVFEGAQLFNHHKSLLEDILTVSNKQEIVSLKFMPEQEFLNHSFIADKTKINQILLNIFRNAIKFTNEGVIEYGIKMDNHEKVTFYVKDSGIGIPNDKQELIFDYFRQGDDSHRRAYGGVGIGLAISKNISKILKGSLSVDSVPGEGSTFSFTLPVETLRKDTPSEISLQKIPDLTGYKILIIDDDPNGLLLLSDLFKGTGVELIQIQCENDKFPIKTKNGSIDLILLDLRISVDEGIKLANKITDTADCPIIALTTHSLSHEKDKDLPVGCSSIISKPIDPEILFNAIKTALAE